MKKSKTLKIVAIFLCGLLFLQQTGFAQLAPSTAEGVASIELNIASRFTTLANTFSPDKFRPLHLRSLSYDGLNNNFKLLLDKGDIKDPKTQDIESTAKDLLNYFFVGIALPNDAFWVNLRPDSPNDIIDPLLAQTEVGKILLEADLQLKKDTANATNPSTPEGREYWNKLYQKAGELYGTQNVTIPTLTRPWIVPDEIIIRESTDSAYVYKATLKVMLEQDYLKGNATYAFKDDREKQLNEYSSQIIREEIIPKLTKEINNAKRYAPLRQVYYSLILAQWFKARNQDKNTRYSRLINRKDLTNLQAKIPYSVNAYFNAYKENFAKGEYNIKEPISTPYGQVIRSYFSGGIAGIAPLIPGLGQSISVNPKGASITLVPGKGQGTADSGMLSVEAPGGGEGVRVIAQPGGLGDLGQGSSGSDAFIKSQFKFTQGALGFAQAKQGNSKVLDALKAARQKLLAEFDLGLERRAQKVLERNVSMTELEGIKKAHAIGEGHFLGKQNEDGSYENNKDPELVFTPEEIARKARILKDAGFTLEERAKLIKFGVAGSAAISSLPSKIKRTIFIWLAITALLFPSLACNDTVPTPVSAVIPTTIVSDSYIATQTAFSPVLGQVGEQIPAVMNFAANVVPSQYQGYVQAFKDVVMTKGVLTGGESVVMDGITVNQGLGYSFLVHPGENNTTEKVEINMQFLQPLMDAAFTIENGQVTIKNATLAYVLFSQFIHEGHHIQNIGTPGGAYNYLKDNELAIWQAVNIYDTNDSAMNNYVRRSAAEALETIIVGEVEGSAGFLSMQYLRDMGITAVNLQENINGSLPPSVEFVLSTAVQQIQVVDPLEYRARLLTSWGYGSRVSWYLPHPDGWSPYILDALANQLLKGDPNRNYGWLADPRLLNIHLDPLSDNIELQVDQYTQLIVDVLASYGIIIPDPTSSSMLAPSKSTTSVSPAHVIFSQSKVVGPLARKGFQRGPGPSISFTGVGDEQQANRNILVGILSILLQQGKITEAELQERLAFDANPKSEPAEDLDLSVDNQNVFMVNGQKVVVIDAPYLSATEEGEQYASAGLRRGVVYITRQKFEELKNNGALEEIIKHEQIESSYLRQKAMEMFPGLDEATAYELFSNFLKNPNNQDQARDLIDEAHQYAESQRHSADTGVSITGQVKTGAAVVQAASSAVNARENIITMRLDKFWNISPWRAKINASNYYNSFENELKEKLESIVVAYKIDYEKFMGILIACDEVALNIMLHGGGGTIQVFLTRADDGTSWIEIIGENNNNKGIKDPRIELENSKVARVNDKANSGGGFLNIVFYPDKVTIETDRKRWEKSGTDKSNVSLVNTATSDVQGTKMTLAWQVGQAVAGSLAEARAVRVEEPVSDTKFPVQTQRQQLQSDPTRKSIRYFPKIFQDDLMRVVKDLDSNQSLLGYTVYFRNIPDLEGVPHKNSWGIQFT
ncbi:MAG: hypothetical protein COV73_05945, partial [Candidatus Omnitrophica bacterium CG11_big_fil_rev_8_21_14_0_20_43_6]